MLNQGIQILNTSLWMAAADGSVEIIKNMPYLAYWQSKPDGGQYKTVEEGFARSTGQIMTWLNSDDKFFRMPLRSPRRSFLSGRILNG